MDESTTYGVKLQVGSGGPPLVYTDIADVISMKPPAIESAGAVEYTGHGTGGKRKYLGSGLTGLSEFTITVCFTKNTTIVNEVDKLGNYKIVFPNSVTWTFSAVCLSFEPAELDGQNPEVMFADVTFQPNDASFGVVP
jgi:hypothetical protein